MGAFDYTMTQTKNAGYTEQFTAEQPEYFYGYPAWVVDFWALAVWGGVGGRIDGLIQAVGSEAIIVFDGKVDSFKSAEVGVIQVPKQTRTRLG